MILAHAEGRFARDAKRPVEPALRELEKLFGKVGDILPTRPGKKRRASMRIDKDGQVWVSWNPTARFDQFLDRLRKPECATRIRNEFGARHIQDLIDEIKRFRKKPSLEKKDVEAYGSLAAGVEAVLGVIEEDELCLPQTCDPPVDTDADATALGKNLGKPGRDKDVIRTDVSNEPEAHHIVAGDHEIAAPARDLLASSTVCIGINDAVNGVWLPKTSGVNVDASLNPQRRVFHNRTQEHNYYRYVNRLLRGKLTRDAVVAVLRRIRVELVAGVVNW